MADVRAEWLETVRRWKLDPDEPATDEYWSLKLETTSRDELGSIQGEKLVKAVAYMFDRSTLFRRKFEELGLGDVRGIEDLTNLPIMTKEDMSEDLQENPPWGTYMAVDTDDWLQRGWQVYQTSGTTAAPRPFFYTRFDREMRALYAMGIRGGRDVGMCCFGYGLHVAMWGLHIGLEHMGVPVVPAGGLDTNARGSAIQRFEPTVLAATPSYALYLGSTMREAGLDPAESSVQRIICLGEPLPSSSRERIEDMWNVSIHQFYGCTEAAPSCGGYTCSSSVHFMEDTHVLETVDPDTLEPVGPGEPGLSVVTNLCSEASPQIRFVVGDFTTLDYEPCECGRTHVRATDRPHRRRLLRAPEVALPSPGDRAVRRSRAFPRRRRGYALARRDGPPPRLRLRRGDRVRHGPPPTGARRRTGRAPDAAANARRSERAGPGVSVSLRSYLSGA